jgi:hypothetical protein
MKAAMTSVADSGGQQRPWWLWPKVCVIAAPKSCDINTLQDKTVQPFSNHKHLAFNKYIIQ